MSDQGNTNNTNDATILGSAGGDSNNPAGNNTNGDPNAKPGYQNNANDGGKDNQNNDANKPQGAPEKYEAFKLPEGLTINPDVEKEFTTLAKELNISQEKAQALLDLQVKVAQKAQEEDAAQMAKLRGEWKDQTLKFLAADKDKSLAYAAKFLDKVGDKDLRKYLDDTGLGDHPSLVKAFIEAGKLISDDNFVEGSAPNSEKSFAEILYPKHTNNQR
jgi:hypothetical protein